MGVRMTLGQFIHRRRKHLHMTQEQLAEKLFVTRTMVSKWEREICLPDYNTVEKIAEVLSVSSDEIISRKEAVINELYDLLADTETSDLMDELNRFLSTLNDRDRSIFVRRYYFLEDSSTIADNYHIKDSLVRTVLMRTRKKLKKYLEVKNK